MNVDHDKVARHFILTTPEGDAVLDYELAKDGRIIFTHTLVPTALRGRGIGDMLARSALTWARETGVVIEIHCPYVTYFLEAHPDFRVSGRISALNA